MGCWFAAGTGKAANGTRCESSNRLWRRGKRTMGRSRSLLPVVRRSGPPKIARIAVARGHGTREPVGEILDNMMNIGLVGPGAGPGQRVAHPGGGHAERRRRLAC